MGFIIAGDTKEYKNCLIYTCMGDKKFAEETLNRLMTNPKPEEAKELSGYTNVHVEETKPEQEWWNDPFLAN